MLESEDSLSETFFLSLFLIVFLLSFPIPQFSPTFLFFFYSVLPQARFCRKNLKLIQTSLAFVLYRKFAFLCLSKKKYSKSCYYIGLCFDTLIDSHRLILYALYFTTLYNYYNTPDTEIKTVTDGEKRTKENLKQLYQLWMQKPVIIPT